MIKRLAQKIAQKHMGIRYPQPLRLQPDYLERNAADFLGENVVQVNTGLGPLRGGPGNVEDEVIADDFMTDELEADDFMTDELEADFMTDELEADFMADDFMTDELEADFEADELEADELEGFEIVDDMGLSRMAEDHDRGSYISRQNLREMSDMADFIVDDIGNEGLDDWVEDKISQSYSAMNDVARYRGYRDDHSHGDEGEHFRFANDEIFDDMGIMADFDKYSRYSKGEKGQEEYEKAKRDGDVPEDFLAYEGSVTSPGEAPDPHIVEENKLEMGKEARYYDIIDDLEW